MAATQSFLSHPSTTTTLHHHTPTTRLPLPSSSSFPTLRTPTPSCFTIKTLSSPSPIQLLTQDDLKKLVADKAVEYVSFRMVLGLDTDSTAAFVVAKLGELLASGQLTNIVGVPTSKRTQEQAASLGIPLSVLDDHPKLDLAINGADEVDPDLNLVKGRSGALLREKLVEFASDKLRGGG